MRLKYVKMLVGKEKANYWAVRNVEMYARCYGIDHPVTLAVRDMVKSVLD
jgi:hypothetical protein